MLPRIHSFPPIAAANATVLILGSMPGEESLRAGQYYAHPRNAFWRILSDLLGAEPGLPYAERVALLETQGIALWDVLASCVRQGSLDSAIAGESIVVNDFPAFFQRHPSIRRVFFNGTTAEKCFVKTVQPLLGAYDLRYQRLTSSSPAHAGLSYAQKLAAWRHILE
jgi:hypoxanthine-DNA glycosylase